MIVDDDLTFVELQRELLEQEGQKVYSFSEAAETHRLTGQVQLDLLVLDLRLPGDVDMDEAGWHVPDQHARCAQTKLVLARVEPEWHSFGRRFLQWHSRFDA